MFKVSSAQLHQLGLAAYDAFIDRLCGDLGGLRFSPPDRGELRMVVTQLCERAQRAGLRSQISIALFAAVHLRWGFDVLAADSQVGRAAPDLLAADPEAGICRIYEALQYSASESGG
jgi:hypothetical protein